MPEMVDDAKDELESNWKAAAAYGGATYMGSNVAGPIGRGAGALAAGTYVGGQTGNAMSAIGMGESLAMLLGGVMGGNQANSATGTEL
jgi:hypothetical protein